MEMLLILIGMYSCIVLILVTMVFFVSQLITDNSIMDICYGPIFAITTWSTMFLTGNFALLPTIVAVFVTIWAARLALRIGRKNWGRSEDPRYAAWRVAWQKHGRFYLIVRSFLQVNVLQGVVIIFVSFPIILAIFAPGAYTSWLLALGLIVSTLGVAMEAIADHQLDRFLRAKHRNEVTTPIMNTGLFAYSRHPNYFGETLVWWGFAVAVLSLPYGWLGLVSPLLITYIVTRVTGPLLENHLLDRYPQAFAAYQHRVRYFLPLPNRYGVNAPAEHE